MHRRMLAATFCFTLLAARSAPGEIFVASDSAVRIFADDANGDVAPLRSISGANTLINSTTNVTIDLPRRELYTSNYNGIHVFDLDAEGDVAPKRSIAGGNTQLTAIRGIAIDHEADEIYVVSAEDDAIRVFDRAASGNVAPKRSIEGAATGLDGPILVFLDLVHDELFVSNINFSGDFSTVSVFDLAASGDVAPKRVLTGANSTIDNPRSVVVDLANDELLVTEYDDDSIKVFHRTDSGAATPLRKIRGGNTGFGAPYEMVLTRDDEMIVGNDGFSTGSIVGHLRTANGDATANRVIGGTNPSFVYPTGVVSDRAKECSAGRAVDGCLFRDNFEGADVCYWSAASGAPACP